MIKLTDSDVGHRVRTKNGYEGLLAYTSFANTYFPFTVFFEEQFDVYTVNGKANLGDIESEWDIVEVLNRGEQ